MSGVEVLFRTQRVIVLPNTSTSFVKQGPTGPQGPQGNPGPAGADGADGTAIVSDGTIVASMMDPDFLAELLAGGGGTSILYDNLADRPAAGTVDDGTVFVAVEDGAIYQVQTGAWVQIGAAEAGPVGPEGPEGPEGPAGPPGSKNYATRTISRTLFR